MTVNPEEPVLPVLRFADFTDEWQQGRVDSFLVLQRGFDLTKKSSGEGSYPVYSSSGISYYHSEFKVRGPGLVTGRKGSVGPVFFVDEDFWPHDTSLWVKDFKGNDVAYCYYFLTHFDLSRFDEASSVPTLNRNNVHRERAAFPTLPEQRKIADFLTAVDGRIGQLSQKKALLEDYKKGVMQQLFTQALRFKDDHGNEFPKWEVRTVDEVAQCLDNLRRPVNGAEREKMKGDIPYYGANGIQGYVNDFIFDEELTLLAEDGGNFDEFATRPIAQRICGKAWVNNRAHILRAKRKMMTPDFLFYSLVHKDIRQYINGSSRAKLNKGDMLIIEMVVPSVPEQTKIANFLTALDRKIESVAQQIHHSQAFKKGLLQQMFV